MIIDYTKYDRLSELENIFLAQIEENEVLLLGDLIVEAEQVNEIGTLINHLLLTKDHKAIRDKFPLTVSVFLVWCSVYHYQEGTLWEPIFKKLEIVQNYQRAEVLGETFIHTIKKHGLQQLSSTERTKKYMSPILMHGYIGEHYAGKLLDYLNAIYTSYLNYDVSEKAMNPMWADIFNLEADQTTIKSEIDQLETLEKEIEISMRKLSVPRTLKSISREGLRELEEKADSIQKQLLDQEEMKKSEEMDIQKLQAAEEELQELQQSISNLKCMTRVTWLNEMRGEMEQLYDTCRQDLEATLHESRARLESILKQEMHLKNLLSIEQGKIKDFKTSILTMGKGREEDGWALLEEYHDLANQLKDVRERLTQKRSLYQIEDQLQNTSLKMVLTASLTHLAAENPALFQQFISSTIHRLDSILKNRDDLEPHRMDQAIRSWLTRVNRKKAGSAGRSASSAVPGKELDSVKRSDARSWRLQLPRLHVPGFAYSPVSRQLYVYIPQQEMVIPKQFQEEPVFEMVYGVSREPLKVRVAIEKQRMLTEDKSVPVKRPDLQGMVFRWFNLREQWPMALEPVMVFDASGRHRIEETVPNGLYFVLVQQDWQLDNRLVMDHYPCGLEGYQIYEVHLEEDVLTVSHRLDDSQESVRIQSSGFSGIVLGGLDLIPGITMGGLSVGTGVELLLTVAHHGLPIESLVFELVYQGVKLHHRPFREMFNLYGTKMSDSVTQLAITPMLAEKYTPYVEIIEMKIRSDEGEVYFETAVCVIKGTRFTFNANELIVKIPLRSAFRHPEARKQGASYAVLLSGEPAVHVDIYYDRIGWRTFRIETPQVRWQWMGWADAPAAGQTVQLLQSQSAALKEAVVRWTTGSAIPQKLVLFDEGETLVTTFHFRNGCVETPIKAFVDLLEDMQSTRQILCRWEGNGRTSAPMTLVELFDRWEIVEATLFQTEKETENLFEISYLPSFDYQGEIRVKVFETERPERMLIQKRVQSNPFYLYLKKDATEVDWITFQIYYEEVDESIFGTEVKEIICWTWKEKRLSKKALIEKVLEKGLILESFTYEGREHRLISPCRVDNISLEPKHFEEEELFKGIISCRDGALDVFFYLDDENRKLPFLIDEDHDGIQYHPVTGELFFDIRGDQRIMSPLDDLVYRIEEENRS